MLRLLAPLLLVLLATLPARAEVPYEVELVGNMPKDLRKDIEAASRLFELRKDRPPASLGALRRRADEDLERLKPLVNGAGYWAAALSYDISEEETPKVTLKVEPGEPYTLQSVSFRTPDGGVPAVLDRYHPSAVGLELGKPAKSAAILAAEPRIAEAFGRNARPWGKVLDRKVVVDHGTRTVAVTYVVDAGREASFGETRIEGLERLDPAWVRRRIEWKPGEPYDARAVEATRKALGESALFSQIRIAPAAEEPGRDGLVPIVIELAERARRSIGAGVSYNTSEGVGTKFFWEHRNLLGGAEKLRLQLDLAQERLGGLAEYREPDVIWRDTDLVLSAELADESPDAYELQKLRLFSGLERRFTPGLTFGAGVAAEQLAIEERGRNLDYTLLGLPLFARYDTTDDLLDPRQGRRVSWTLTPWGGIAGPADAFVSTRVLGSAYYSFDDRSRYTLAGFAAVGTILGESRDIVPADKRLYAGGGGSVRGYGYQRVGPLDADDKPIGGRGSLEAGLELRIRITETIGIAPFLEMGMVNEDALPIDKPFFGAGIGARYFTAVGPVRFDVGVPLNKRSSDDSFQIYVSLGQAF